MSSLDWMELLARKKSAYLSNYNEYAGTKKYEYFDGKEKGVQVLDMYSGSGFQLSVLLSRGMDIAQAKYCGMPIGFVSKSGILPPQFFQNGDCEYMRLFYGGLLTTCGLTQAGMPCKDIHPVLGEINLGLHGQINCTPADKVNVDERWDNEEYVITASGRVRQAMVYAENITMERKIVMKAGQSNFKIIDEITNEDDRTTPLMVLYHMNFAYPVISEDSRIYSNYDRVEPYTDFAKKGRGIYNTFLPPQKNFMPENFSFLNTKNKEACVMIANEKIGFGAYLKFDTLQLPYLTEWQLLAHQDYVLGLEPGNCMPEGRCAAREADRLEMIEGGETKHFEIEFGVLDSQEQINTFKKAIVMKCL